MQAFPPSGGKWQVSVNGGNFGYWRRDGKEIVFDAPDRSIMAVDVKLGATFEAGVPKRLFQLERPSVGGRFAMTADAQRFLIGQLSPSGDRSPLRAILNWSADLTR